MKISTFTNNAFYNIVTICINNIISFILIYTDMRNYSPHILFAVGVSMCTIPYLCRYFTGDIKEHLLPIRKQSLTHGNIFDIAAIIINVITLLILTYTGMRNYNPHILFAGNVLISMLPALCKHCINDIENDLFFEAD